MFGSLKLIERQNKEQYPKLQGVHQKVHNKKFALIPDSRLRY